jgi:hypothetical protein
MNGFSLTPEEISASLIDPCLHRIGDLRRLDDVMAQGLGLYGES